jgi:acetyltransferase-like isoleucine patch superfamily enzyme
LILEGVTIGPRANVDSDAKVGCPLRRATNHMTTDIGADAIIRSGAVIYLGVSIGDGFQCGHGAVIREGNRIGNDCSVGTNAVLEPGNTVGDGTRIHSGAFLEHTTIGHRVFIAPNVVFTDDLHPACPRFEECVLGAVVEDDVSIGGNATIAPGVRIGAGSLVGAGSVVVKDVPPGVVVAGNPARVVREVRELVCIKGYFERPYIWRDK